MCFTPNTHTHKRRKHGAQPNERLSKTESIGVAIVVVVFGAELVWSSEKSATVASNCSCSWHRCLYAAGAGYVQTNSNSSE